MANGFGSLYIGQSGLQGAQNALNVTANNLANVDTKGYVRQQVRFTDQNYTNFVHETSTTMYQQSGLGVSIGDVAHARDIFLDKAYRQETGRQSFYSACYDVSSYVEDLFQEMNGEEFKQSISDLWTAFQELAKSPADSVNQNLVVQKADLFVSRTQTLYSDLQSYQDNLNTQITDQVNKVNEIGNRIYDLNLQIQKIEAGGMETAMTLRDERDNLLDSLAGYANITASEDATGFTTVSIEGVDFIEEGRCYNIGIQEENGTGFVNPYWPQISDTASGEYVPVFRTTGVISTENNNDIGSIKALLISRGSGYGRASDLDTENYSKIEDCTVMETEAEIDKLFHQITTTMNDLFCPNTELQSAITIDGTTYPAGTKILDTENCNVGADGKLPPQELFTRIGTDRYTEVTDSATGKTYYIYNEESDTDPSKQYIIGSVNVNSNLLVQVTRMPSFKQDGAVDYTMTDAITKAWESESMTIDPSDDSPCTFETYYDKMIGKLANNGGTYKTSSETLTATCSSVDNSRKQISGVSSDEELTNMVKYQSAYNAASRYITVISQMTELIVTGLI